MAVDVGEPPLDAVVVVRKPGVIEPEEVEERGVEVGDRLHLLHGLVAEVVGGTVVVSPSHPRARQPDGEPGGVVVAAAGPALEGGHPPELGDEGHHRVGKQPPGLEVGQQGGRRLIEDRAVDGVLLDEGLVAVPVSHPLPHRIGAIEELHEAHPALQQPPRQDAVAGEARLEGIPGVEGPVAGERGRRLVGEVGHTGGGELHPRRQLVGGDPGGKVAVARMARQAFGIEPADEGPRRLVGRGRDARGPRQVGDRFVGVEGGALEHRGEERRRPLPGPHLWAAARIGDGDEGGQVAAFAPQGVGRPRPHARETVEREPGRHLVLGRPVGVAPGGHRVDEAHLVGQRAQVRQQLAGHRATLPARAELPLRADEVALLPLEGDELAPRHRQRRVVAPHELRFPVEGVDVRQGTRAEDHQHPRRARRKVRWPGRERVGRIDDRADRVGGQQPLVGQQGRQGDSRQAAPGGGEEPTPVEELTAGGGQCGSHGRRPERGTFDGQTS